MTIPGQAAHQLRQKYNVSGTGLTVVLVGKDGGEKLTQRDFLSANQLFGTIDQMPMRKREMREKKSG